MAIFTESHDSEIQLAPSSADDFQRIAHGSGEKERGIGTENRSPYHRLDVGVACVEKRPPCLHWLIPLTAKAKMWTAARALSFILFVTSLIGTKSVAVYKAFDSVRNVAQLTRPPGKL